MLWLSPRALHRPACATLLDAFGPALGVAPDPEDEKSEITAMLRAKTAAMEAHLRRWLEARVEVCDATRKTTQQVREIMARRDPPPALWRPVLESCTERAWRGTPALLVRADILDEVWGAPVLMDPSTLHARAPPHCPDHRAPCALRRCGAGAAADPGEDEEDGAWAWACPRRGCRYRVDRAAWTLRQWPRGAHYRVVHVHYGSLDVLRDGRTLSRGAALAGVRARALALNAMLGDMQGFCPPTAFVVGRCYRSSAWKAEGANCDCTALLPEVFHHDTDTAALEARAAEVRDMQGWDPARARAHLVSEEHRRELRGLGWPWRGAARQLVGAPPPPPRAVLPARLDGLAPGPLAACAAWRAPAEVEFVGDFETVSSLDDDFSTFPAMGGTPMIFMIGCGTLRRGAWDGFRHFVAGRLHTDEEKAVVQAWLDHMAAAAPGAPVLHWSRAERDMYAAARRRHPRAPWPAELPWRDACTDLYRHLGPLLGLPNTRLKQTCAALRDVIRTKWEADGPGDGESAMTGAWWLQRHAAEQFATHPLMQSIAHYNYVDCKTVSELVHLARTLLRHA